MLTKSQFSLDDLLLLSSFGKIGPRGFAKLQLLGRINLQKVSAAAMAKAGIASEVGQEFVRFRSDFNADQVMDRLHQQNIVLVSAEDAKYPPLLKEISDPPYLLYVLGSLAPLHQGTLAIVGSRKHSHYSESIIEQIVPPLAEAGITIVSGLAFGVDALAHRSCLANNGQTVAVVGCGLDVIYPTEHQTLAKKIVEQGGGVVTEYPLGTPPLRQHFPARNRLISGVSQGTLVVECDIKSGAMITAHHALDQNRDVYAVPGSITSPYSTGPNALLRMGATVVISPEDLLERLGLPSSPKQGKVLHRVQVEHLPLTEATVFKALGAEPLHIDSLVEHTKLDMADVNSALLFLEMKGLVRNVGAAQYVRR